MNWRDYISIAAIVVVLIIIGFVLGDITALRHTVNWSIATVALAVIGFILAVVISPIMAPTSKPESLLTAFLAIVAVVLAVYGFFANNLWIFVGFGVTLVVLWVLTTIYHVQEHEGRHQHRSQKAHRHNSNEL